MVSFETFVSAADHYRTVQQGALFGLQIILFTEQEQYLVLNSAAAGFKVYQQHTYNSARAISFNCSRNRPYMYMLHEPVLVTIQR